MSVSTVLIQYPVTVLLGAFTMPAVNATGTVFVGSTLWMVPEGQNIAIQGLGTLLVTEIVDPFHAVVQNQGVTGNASPGTIAQPNSIVGVSGAEGQQGIQGANAFTTTTAGFTQPAVSGTVNVAVVNSSWTAVGSYVFVATAGNYLVTAVPDATHVTIQNTGAPGNASPGSTIGSPLLMTASGPVGPQGVIGLSALTTTTASFTQPTVGGTVNPTVVSSAWASVGEYVFVATGGTYLVTAVPDSTHVTIQNTGATGNAGSGSAINSGSLVSPSGVPGSQGATGPTGTGVNLGTATSIATSGNVPNFGVTPGVIQEDIDISAVSPITRTLPSAGNTPNGSIYIAKLVNLTGPTAQIQPVTFHCPYPIEDPENPGYVVSNTVKCAVLGACIWWRRNQDTGMVIITPFPLQMLS